MRPEPPDSDFAPALAVLQEGVVRRAMPGGVICIRRHGRLVLHQAFGTRDGDTPTTVATRYDLASLTKPLSTGASLLTLLEAGVLTLTATLDEFFGDMAGDWSDRTVRHLLTHTSGLPAWVGCYDGGLGQETAVRTILAQAPQAEAGKKYAYSCLGFILLQKIIEQVSGQTLSAFAQKNIFAPHHLNSLTYRPVDDASAPLAPTISREGPDKDTVLLGRVHDGNARGIGGVSGNAGLFGTAYDVARFGQLLLPVDGNAPRLFGAPTRERILTDQTPAGVGAHTLLFFAQGNGLCPCGDLLSPETVGHSGYTGTLLTLDPRHEMVIALVTNSVYTPDGGDSKSSFLSYRRKFLNAVAGCLR